MIVTGTTSDEAVYYMVLTRATQGFNLKKKIMG